VERLLIEFDRLIDSAKAVLEADIKASEKYGFYPDIQSGARISLEQAFEIKRQIDNSYEEYTRLSGQADELFKNVHLAHCADFFTTADELLPRGVIVDMGNNRGVILWGYYLFSWSCDLETMIRGYSRNDTDWVITVYGQKQRVMDEKLGISSTLPEGELNG
jgi:hypothetical protein